MKKNLVFIAFLALAACTITGCKKDDEPQESYMIVEGIKYILTDGDLFFQGANGMEADLYNFTISMVSDGLVYDSWLNSNPSYSGNGLLIAFYLRSAGTIAPTEGDYPLGLLSGVRCLGGGYEVDFSTQWTSVKEIDTGSLSIQEDGETYTVEYEGIDEYGNAVELHYSGTLNYHDISD